MINEQELAEAVERLREGEQVLGVSDDDVLRAMRGNYSFVHILLSAHLGGSDTKEFFEEKFNEIARYELREAYRTKLENEAGL